MTTHDYQLNYCGYWDTEPRAFCRVRIYDRPDDADGPVPPVVIITELPANSGTSVTNLCEHVCYLVAWRHWPGLVSDGVRPATFLEHYPADLALDTESSYDLVTFADWRVRADYRYGKVRRAYPSPPLWRRLERATVEAMVGGPLDDRIDTPLATLREERRARLLQRSTR